ncbi:MAG: carboxy terminal-processing peptidase [Sedimenticola sp.]
MNIRKLLLLTLLLGLWSTGLWADAKEVPVAELEPTREQQQSALLILRVVDRYHYKEQRLDDEMSSNILDRYLESLDPNKSFFSYKDIERFEVYRGLLDDALRTARLDSPFDIFKVFRQRVDESVGRAVNLLDKEFDFSIDERYHFDRSEQGWAKDSQALGEIWRKRVKSDILGLRLKDKADKEIKETLKKRYLGIRRRTHQLSSTDIFQTFVNAYTLSLEPHTAYMSPRVSENFNISMRLSLEGIGAVLSSKDEYTEVQRTVLGGPARLSGKIQSGDRIIGVGQGVDGEVVDIIGWRLQDVVDKIRGPKGTTVRLRVLPESEGTDGRASLVTLVRNKIKLEDQAAKKSIIEGLDNMGPVRIGVIDLPTFYRDFQGQSNGVKDSRSTTEDVRKLIGELMDEGIDGLVIDLRENGGGALTEAVELTGLFIPSGPVVQVKNSSGELEVEQDPDPKLVYGGPLAVLVDRDSASASEIFAGAIQDYRRGIVIGEPTFGKGTVQTLVDLGRLIPKGNNKLGLLRLTMAQFFRINGGSTQFRGVVPDIIYPSASDSEEHGERGLDNALPWAEIRPASFEYQGLSSLQKYRGQHQARIKSDPGFLYLENQAALLKEVRDRDTVSLKESERKKEWESRESRRKKLKNSFREAVGLKILTVEEEEAEGKKRLAAGNNHDDPFSKIMLNEAARILSDYIVDQTRSVMAH